MIKKKSNGHLQSLMPVVLNNSLLEDVPFEFEYTFRPGSPARPYLRDGSPGYPSEENEIEIINIRVNVEELQQNEGRSFSPEEISQITSYIENEIDTDDLTRERIERMVEEDVEGRKNL